MSSEREAFEAWFDPNDSKNYWDCWQASRKVALEEAAIAAESGFKYAKDGYQIADDIRNLK